MAYDSRPDTYEHKAMVQREIHCMVSDLLVRGEDHDRSKLASPEVEVFDAGTPKLEDSTYGSDEYKGFVAEMGEGLAHHYAHNSHHPEHYPDGINGMSLLDLLEMLCDWKAATERHDDGDIGRNIRAASPHSLQHHRGDGMAMSPLVFIPLAFFGTSATLTVLFVFACREIRSWKPSPVETAVRDLRTATESFSPPECLNEWERRCWEPVQSPVVQAETFLAEAVNQ